MLRGIRSVFKSQKNPLKSLYINTINKRFCSTELPPELQATEVLLDLLRYDNNERGNLWFQRFYNSLKTASLKGDIEPQVLTGPDSMPYFRLATPHYGEKFENYTFSNSKFLNFCVDHGLGAIIFNSPHAAEVADFDVVSYHLVTFGEVLSFKKYKSFFGDPKDLFEIQERQLHPSIAAETDWHGSIIPPDDQFLPKESREFLKTYINTVTDDIRVPRVAMKVDPSQPMNGFPSRILTINYTVEDFPTKDDAEVFLEYVQWFLPPSMNVSLLQSKKMLEFIEEEDSPFIVIDSYDEYTNVESIDKS